MLAPAGQLKAATFPEFVDPNPAAGNQFGATVVALSTGNVVITSPFDDAGGFDAGAVYLFDGATGALISTLRGSTTGDQVGEGGVTALASGNYLVLSPRWDNGAAINAGAVSWGSGTSGVSGAVSAANSLVGSTTGDRVGEGGVTVLPNGNYVVGSPKWDAGAVVDAGAVSWGNGASGVFGEVAAANSLVGSTAGDRVGEGGVTVLANGNYVVASANWDSGAIANAGAVSWGSGTTGVSGAVTAANSLVGSKANDQVGGDGVTALANGNYVVASHFWDDGAIVNAGAVSWGSGTTGVSGAVSGANSLIGSTASDVVGNNGVTALANGNYVVVSHLWDNDAIVNAGAVSWGDGTTGASGAVSAANSLVGSRAQDFVGNSGVAALANGNYVVVSANWNNGGIASAGAVSWGDGTAGVSGPVSAANSLVGSTAGDQVGAGGVTALVNGNYVVGSPFWDDGAIANVGAASWGSGTTGVSGVISADNSLVGSTANDFVGGGVTALANGNYVVRSPTWYNGSVVDAGAVTWGSGTSGVSGAVSVANSLVGSSVSDQVGSNGVTALANGNYVVASPGWDNGAVVDAGAVSWGSGTSSVSGAVSAANSLVGSTAGDQVGGSGVTALPNGNYVVGSANWDNGAIANAGAASWGSGASGVSGSISAANSLVGTTVGDLVANGGVTALGNGNYVVGSPSWNKDAFVGAGAASWGSDTTGVNGEVSGANSVVGLAANTNLQSIVEDSVNGTFLARFLDEGGGRVRVGPVATVLNAPEPTTRSLVLALEGARPNPTVGQGLHVVFTLPSGAAARLELLDVSGRRVLAREVGSLGAGRHTVRLADGRHVPPGLYWLRLSQGAYRKMSRVAVIG